MSQIAYVNGQYVPRMNAVVNIEDRGYQFADGIYEVICIKNRRLVDEERHLLRLERSLKELRIAPPMARKPLSLAMRHLLRVNRITDGIIYLQITRGVAKRDHAFPVDVPSALVMTVNRIKLPTYETLAKGAKVISIPDIRWKRRDIKSISLLPNCLGKQQAREAGAYEAWMIDDDGSVTEGTSSNAWIVTAEGELVTRRADSAILNGITRLAILDKANEHAVRFVERPFTLEEAKNAREAFLTSTTSFLKPVVEIDGEPVGDGRIGALSDNLLKHYFQHMADQTGGA